jgi:hypothetical protein
MRLYYKVDTILQEKSFRHSLYLAALSGLAHMVVIMVWLWLNKQVLA